MQQNFESLRALQGMVARNVKEYLGLPLRTEFVQDSEGRNVLYMNFTSATGQTAGDTAIFVRAIAPISQDYINSLVARTNTPNHVIAPAPIFEIWVENDASFFSDRAVLKDRILFFLNQKMLRSAILNVTDAGNHPELEGVFGAGADSAIAGSSDHAVAAAGMLGGN